MKTIQTSEGEIKLLEPPVELLREIRSYLPYGIVRLNPPEGRANFGIVMQCGEVEVMAIKQQSVDLDADSGAIQFRRLPIQSPPLEPQPSGSWENHFGQEFGTMIRSFIRALVEGAAATRLPIQETIIGMDVRQRMQLGTVIFGFMVLGNNLICLRTTINEEELTWSILRKTGVTELYHLPSCPLALQADALKNAKPDFQQHG